MRRLNSLFIIGALFILALPLHAQQTCVLSGYIYRNDLTPAADHILRVNSTVPLDSISSLFAASASSDTSDATGFIELTVRRNSVIYLSCDPRRPVKGIPTAPPGIALTIPDAPTHQLATLIPATQVPLQHIVAIPAQNANYGDSIRIADSLARLANERVLSPPHGDSLRTADSLARVALDSASAARQELLTQVAALQAQLDTAGAATRAVIEADIATLYGQVSTLSGQIADLSAQVDTLGTAARAALEADVATLDAENAAQDIAIGYAGKWDQAGSEITPKAGITSVRPPGATFKDDSATVYKKVTFVGSENTTGVNLVTMGGHYYDAAFDNWGRLGLVKKGSNINGGGLAYFSANSSSGELWLKNNTITLLSALGGNLSMTGTLTADTRLSVASPANNQYSANFGGNVWVNPDSMLHANNVATSGGTLTVDGGAGSIEAAYFRGSWLGNNTNYSINYSGGTWNYRGFGGHVWATGSGDWRMSLGAGSVAWGTLPADSLLNIRGGVHLNGGIKAEGVTTTAKVVTGVFNSTSYSTNGGGIDFYSGGGGATGGLNAKVRSFNSSNQYHGGLEWWTTHDTQYRKMVLAAEGGLRIGNTSKTHVAQSSAVALTVEGHIQMTDRDSTAELGTIRTPLLVRDSLNAASSDSLQWVEIERTILPGYGSDETFVEQEFRFTAPNNFRDFVLEFDSANGVKIFNALITVRSMGYDYGSSNSLQGYGTFIVTSHGVSGLQVSQSSGDVSIYDKPWLQWQNHTSGMGIVWKWRLQVGHGYGSPMVVEIKTLVKTTPAVAASSFLCRITDL